ncbi:MAG: N-acetyltransferase [Actinomycetes bacterium]
MSTTGGAIEVVTLRERPDLEEQLWYFPDEWPRFTLQDPVADLYFADVEKVFPDFVLLAVQHQDGAERAVARALSVPFAFGDDVRRPSLPTDGWDGVIRWAWADRIQQRRPNAVSALEITVLRGHRGTGLSSRMLEAMKANARRLGFPDLVAPVRPTGKSGEPMTAMQEYIGRARPDGLPVDPWLRVHVRAGGRVVGVCPRSMTISGTLAEWRRWTGLPFDTSGDVLVEGALVPVHCDVVHDHVVYVEPNVWVHHALEGSRHPRLTLAT